MIYHLFRKTRKAKARKAYAEAKAAADQAEARRDTRSIHETRKALGDAMTELLKAESVRVVRRHELHLDRIMSASRNKGFPVAPCERQWP